MIKNPAVLAKMFLHHRKHCGARDFRFRPRLRQQDGMNVIDIRAKDGTFGARVLVRPDSSDLAAFEQVFLENHYDLRRLTRYEELATLYRSFPKPLILDLGANVGFASLYFRRFWPSATVVAVEPDANNVELLRRNAPGTAVIHAGIASKICRIKIANPDAAPWAYKTEEIDVGAIEATTVPTILDGMPACQPFICKIDIEGAEKELFSQNTDWIQRFPVVIVEVHDWLLRGQLTAKNFLRAIANLDRDFINLSENIWSIANVRYE
jgi:FkbM family methyltransferase